MSRSILFCYAHPDDESFFAAGTIAKYARAGDAVSVVCATRGQRGATGGLCSIEELPVVREAELRSAAKILGVRHLTVLDYEDQKLSAAPPDDMRRHLVRAVREIRPQIVITFDPNGANRHPDHMAISGFTLDAVAAAADPRWDPQSGNAHSVQRMLWTSPVPVFELGYTEALESKAGVDFLIDIRPFRVEKESALRAHRTQLPGFRKLFFEKPDIAQTLSLECFRLGWSRTPIERPAPDLFTNLTTD